MFGFRFFTIIPEKSQYIVERFGRFHQVLNPGLNFLVPILDRIAYKHSMKEEAVAIEKQQAITKDNVTIQIDGIMFVQVADTYKASYKVENPRQAVQLLCLTILRSEIGKMKLDQLLQERAELNKSIYNGLNLAAEGWGLKCNSVEILQIDPPEEIKKSMQYEAEAERLKRRDILKSEGQQLSEINIAKGAKAATVLRAQGDAESVKLVSEAEANALKSISTALANAKETKVVDYILLSNYLSGYSNTLQKSNIVVVPKGKGDSSNDLMNLAGMMLFTNQSKGSNQPYRYQEVNPKVEQTHTFTSHVDDNKKSAAPSSGQSKPDGVSVENFIKRGVYYDDISLYSSGEEGKKERQRK